MRNFIYLWATETVKQQGLVKSKIVKSFYFLLSESGGVEKCQLIKTTFQSVRKALQFHGSSTDKPRVSVLAPTGVGSISGMIIYSTLGIPFPARLCLLHSNTLASLRNEPSDVQLITVDEISMVSKKCLYQIHQLLIKFFNVPNILFAGKSILVVGDLYQSTTWSCDACICI